MVPLKKLRGVYVPEEYKHVYRHYLDEEVDQVEKAYNEFIGILDTCHTNKKSQQINQKIKSQTPFSVFMDKTYKYFLKIIYVLINDSNASNQAVSIRTCIKDASEYAVAEYLSKSIVASIT